MLDDYFSKKDWDSLDIGFCDGLVDDNIMKFLEDITDQASPFDEPEIDSTNSSVISYPRGTGKPPLFCIR